MTPEARKLLEDMRDAAGDVATFTAGKSQLLPITQRERNLNPNVRQNPGW